MKKIVVILLAAVMAFGLIGCLPQKDGINVYMPDGATALSLAYMMKNHEEIDGQKVNYNVVPPETISDFVRNESADIIILPANAAVGLYNQGADYKIAAVMTHGNLFIIGREAESLTDLVGSVMAVIGSGSIPELVLKTLFKRQGIDCVESDTAVDGKVAFIYVGDGTAARELIVEGKAEFAFLAEPAATGVVNFLKDDYGTKQLFNVQTEWKNAMEEDGLDYSNGFPQAVLFVKNSVSKATVNKFLAECKAGDGWAAENAAEAVETIKAHALEGTTSTMPNVGGAIINKCNIKTVTDDLDSYIGEFLSVLKEHFSNSVVPKDANVYYSAE